MAGSYNSLEIEPKWQRIWEERGAFRTPDLEPGDEKAYILDFFPYPSGAGLHVGHLLGYTGTDIIARVARKQGKKVLHPMGWDAFGLPAENYAIKSGIHPAISTRKNIEEFKRQFRQSGISYDWSKEINTSEPEYYKWTQWLFSVLYQRGLAYRKKGMVNWCPSCQTVLANEQVVAGQCERCSTTVIQKELEQWYFRITQYADRLLADLEKLDWPEKIKAMQRNWIGRSEGAQLFFSVKGREERIEVFTTRPDTLFGATYLVLAPEHPLVPSLTTTAQQEAVERYQRQAAEKSELERTFLGKEKTGVSTGAYAINPATGEEIPIWVADYVISTYGTGAIMAVPAHDERDYAFATVFHLPIRQVVIAPTGAELPYLGQGILQESGEFTGLDSKLAQNKIATTYGLPTVTYRLRDWLVSRQRFWGAPIPIAYDQDGIDHLLPFEQLPVKLPDDAEFLPTGQSPLLQAVEWRTYTDPESGQLWTREADTLDTFVCSSWYYLRFPTPHDDKEAFNRQAIQSWLPVDLYVGGAEHAVLHLLYARFFTKALFDAGYLDFDEPFQNLRNPGMILGPDHNKMSKSKGNVINPDDVVRDLGADTLRVYEMFMAPFEMEKPWSTKGIAGVRRFLEKVWKLQEKVDTAEGDEAERRIAHRMVKKVAEDIAQFKFNTAVSAMMEAVNGFAAQPRLSQESYLLLISVLNPFAPHLTEELWEQLGQPGLVSLAPWPAYEERYLIEEEVEYPVQVNGKVRARLRLPINLSDVEVLTAVKTDERVQPWLVDVEVIKEIVVPGRLVSLVVRKLQA